MNWKSLVKRLPHKPQVTAKVCYGVLSTPSIVGGPDCYGVMRPDLKQITPLEGMTPKNKTLTYLHEVTHAFSEEYDLGLTETQVRKIEKALYYILKEGNILKDE